MAAASRMPRLAHRRVSRLDDLARVKSRRRQLAQRLSRRRRDGAALAGNRLRPERGAIVGKAEMSGTAAAEAPRNCRRFRLANGQ